MHFVNYTKYISFYYFILILNKNVLFTLAEPRCSNKFRFIFVHNCSLEYRADKLKDFLACIHLTNKRAFYLFYYMYIFII